MDITFTLQPRRRRGSTDRPWPCPALLLAALTLGLACGESSSREHLTSREAGATRHLSILEPAGSIVMEPRWSATVAGRAIESLDVSITGLVHVITSAGIYAISNEGFVRRVDLHALVAHHALDQVDWVGADGDSTLAFSAAAGTFVIAGPADTVRRSLIVDQLTPPSSFVVPAGVVGPVVEGAVLATSPARPPGEGTPGRRWAHAELLLVDLKGSDPQTLGTLPMEEILWSPQGFMHLVFAPRTVVRRATSMLGMATGDVATITILDLRSGERSQIEWDDFRDAVEVDHLTEWQDWAEGLWDSARYGPAIRPTPLYPIISNFHITTRYLWVDVSPWVSQFRPRPAQFERPWLVVDMFDGTLVAKLRLDPAVALIHVDDSVAITAERHGPNELVLRASHPLLTTPSEAGL